MKTTLFLITMLLSQTALANGSWMFSRDNETAAASEPTIAPAAQLARKPAAKPVTKTETKTETKTKTDAKTPAKKIDTKCAPNFDAAQALFKEVYGADVDLLRMGQFAGNFKDYTSTNQFKKNGGSLWLNLNIGGMINTDVPVCVRRTANGKSLTAAIITSNAKEGGTNQPQAMITQMVANGQAPSSISLSVNRRGGNLVFTGNGASATAAVR